MKSFVGRPIPIVSVKAYVDVRGKHPVGFSSWSDYWEYSLIMARAVLVTLPHAKPLQAARVTPYNVPTPAPRGR